MTAKSITAHTTVKVPVYTTPAGYARLDEVLTANRRLYNAALQHRRDAYKMAGVSISKAAQSRELTLVVEDDPFWQSVSRRIAVGTLERIDLAFKSFFRRSKAGEKPGYPRFKNASRFSTLEMYAEPAWFKTPRRIRVKGLPALRLRAPLPAGKPLTLRLTRRHRRWYACITMEVEKQPLPPSAAAVGLDLGVSDRFHSSDGVAYPAPDNDNRAARRYQRQMARRKPKPFQRASKGYRRAQSGLAKTRRQQANRRLTTAHQATREIVNRYGVIAIEKLAAKRMTKSAAGTLDNPGKNVAAKRGLNREILNQGWGEIRRQLTYKAAWAGRELRLVDPRHTSRICSSCGVIEKRNRKGKQYVCACGNRMDADHNAAINILRLALRQAGANRSPAAPQGVTNAGIGRRGPRKLLEPGAIQGSLL